MCDDDRRDGACAAMRQRRATPSGAAARGERESRRRGHVRGIHNNNVWACGDEVAKTSLSMAA